MSAPSRKELAEVVLMMAKKHGQTKTANKLANYLIRERRSNELEAIMRETERLRRKRDSIEEVTITSAHTLSPAQKTKLARLLGLEKVVINEVINEDVVGGVRIETSDRQLDLTVRNRLNRLKQV